MQVQPYRESFAPSLEQSNSKLAFEVVKRISRGEIGELAIGYISALTHDFLESLSRRMRERCSRFEPNYVRSSLQLIIIETSEMVSQKRAHLRGNTCAERSAGVGVVTSPVPD